MNFTKIITVFLLIISIFSIPVYASDDIDNPGFETGTMSGWTVVDWVSSSIVPFNYQAWGNYSLRTFDRAQFQQIINCSGHSTLSFDYYTNDISKGSIAYSVIHVSGSPGYYNSGDLGIVNNQIDTININLSGWQGRYLWRFRITGLWGGAYVYADNFTLDHEVIWEPLPESFIQFEDTPYKEYDNAIVNFSVEKIMNDYSDKRIFLEIATPKVSEPYYNYVAYELDDYIGYRGLAITGKSPVYDVFHNCSAFIRAYEQDMSDYETLLEIEESVLSDNHTLINYTGWDYPTNKSYITGQNIGLLVDIMDYIETDFLGYPDELFTVWVKGFSNSNQGNTEQSFDLDAIYWDADRYYIKHIECAPFSIIDSHFNATVESYVSVYRNGNTTRLTPTIYTNMYNSDYIPEGEEGYIPPDIPEEPEDPDTGENETLPENPTEPDIPTVTNQSINTSWVYYYYEGVNNSFDTLLSPVYNFTAYTLTPIYLLNDSISDYNYIMNESFNETTQKINILSNSFNIIYNSFHPKIVGVITYYLLWLVLLIILKKR